MNPAEQTNDRPADPSLDDQVGALLTADDPAADAGGAADPPPDDRDDDPDALIASADSFASPEEAEAIEEDLAKQIQELLDHGDEAAFDDADAAQAVSPTDDAEPTAPAEPAAAYGRRAGDRSAAADATAVAPGPADATGTEVTIDEIDAMLADEADAFEGHFETVEDAIAAAGRGAAPTDDAATADTDADRDAEAATLDDADDEPAETPAAAATADDVAAELDADAADDEEPAWATSCPTGEADAAVAATADPLHQATHAAQVTIKAAGVTAAMAGRALHRGCAAVNAPLSYFSDTTKATVGYVGLQVLLSGVVLIAYALLR